MLLENLGFKKRIHVGISLSANNFIELVCVDKNTKSVVNYSSSNIKYNSAIREIIDFDEFNEVLQDLFEDAGDLDIAVTKKGLDELKSKYDLKQKENGWYIVNDKVECVLDTKEDWKIEKVGDYYLESLEKYFEYLKTSKRDKDKIKYIIVEKALKERR